MIRRCALIGLALLAAAQSARAERLADWLRIDGYADLRVIQTDDERTSREGGTGRLRYGGDANGARSLVRAEAGFVPVIQFSGELDAVGTFVLDGGQPAYFGLAEGYVRWKPAPTSDWRFTVRAGFLIPPFSLSNDGIAWTSRTTLTWSAIDTWLGEEVRALGVEPKVEYWFDERDHIDVVAGLFTDNDISGTILAQRGWMLHDQLAVTTTRLKGPTAYDNIAVRRQTITRPFVELDDRPGWYGLVTAARDGVGKIAFGHYDNLADPRAAGTDVAGWRTHFNTLGVQYDLPDLHTVLTAQGMKGYTALRIFSPISTVFESVYGSVSHDLAREHKVTARWDWFRTVSNSLPTSLYRGEIGQAATAAYIWRPATSWRFTVEAVHVRSARALRTPAYQSYITNETQLQAGVRFFF
ncbi:hypothetical protein [Roseiterribacter gracilis]|uniref:Porin domain-containing protein n=1 Tax=Roseiterribacter gracilis TaxID=2812848 RepID=A0A8S8XAM4_9PROT|nr:hypothetical protein TMPK1_06440 [Rhodospirillales bacterium TMPK1]